MKLADSGKLDSSYWKGRGNKTGVAKFFLGEQKQP